MRVVIRNKMVQLAYHEDDYTQTIVDLPDCKISGSGEPLIVGINYGYPGNFARIGYITDVNFGDQAVVDSAEEITEMSDSEQEKNRKRMVARGNVQKAAERLDRAHRELQEAQNELTEATVQYNSVLERQGEKP